MKRHFVAWPIVAACLALTGCKDPNDYYAKAILKSDCGMLARMSAGGGDTLVKREQIDKHLTIPGTNGAKIDVWVILAGDKGAASGARPTVLLLHGLTESKGYYLDTGKALGRKGYNVVLMDLRAHGKSTGQYIGYGAVEKADARAVMNELVSQKLIGPPFYVFGATLGGATAIQYAAIEPRVKGVIAVAPYRDAASIGRRRIGLIAPTMSQEHFAKVLARAGTLGKFDPADTSAVEAARKITCPLLLVHGFVDLAVPLGHSEEIHKAASEPKRLMVITPPEQLVLLTFWHAWVADRMDEMIRTGAPPAVKGIEKDQPPAPATEPAAGTKPAAAPKKPAKSAPAPPKATP